MEEKAALKKRNIELLDAQERAQFEAQRAILSLADAEEFVESQKLSLQRAEEGLRLAVVGYREGVNTEVEVTDARAALTRAKGLHYQAVYSHALARLDLQRAMGILGPRAGDNTVPTEPPSKPSHIDEFSVPGDKDVPPPAEPKAPAPVEAENTQGGT
jgi:outer membrane protein TolC